MNSLWAAKRFWNRSLLISPGELVALAAAMARAQPITRNRASLVSVSCDTSVTPSESPRASPCKACHLHQKRHQFILAAGMRNSGNFRTRILNERQIRSICRPEILVSSLTDVPPLPSMFAPPDAILVPYSQPPTQDDSEQSNRSGDSNACGIHRPISHRDDEPLSQPEHTFDAQEGSKVQLGGFKGSREPARIGSATRSTHALTGSFSEATCCSNRSRTVLSRGRAAPLALDRSP